MHIMKDHQQHRGPVIVTVLVTPRRKGFHQFPLVRELKSGAVDHKQRSRYVRQWFPHQPLELFKYVVSHATGYQFGHFESRLAIATRSGGDPALANPFAHLALLRPVNRLAGQKLDGRGQRPLAV
jgi:hypothetical protein